MVTNDGRIDCAASEFCWFAMGWDTPELRADFAPLVDIPKAGHRQYLQDNEIRGAYLQTYLSEWIRHGNGVEQTEGDFDIWNRTVIDIADRLMCDRTTCDYYGRGGGEPYERPTVGIHLAEDELAARSLERAGYLAEADRVGRELHWRRGRDGLYRPW